jgi:FkbM family methyltransferase
MKMQRTVSGKGNLLRTYGKRPFTTVRVVCNLATYATLRLTRMVNGRNRLGSPWHWYHFPFHLNEQILWSPALGAWFCPADEAAIECMLKLPDYEPVDWVAPQTGQVFIDVGAYVGWYSIWAARAVGGSGRVIAFEPDETNRRQLQRNLALNGIQHADVYPLAAWSRSGKIGWRPGTEPVWHRVDELSPTAATEAITIDELVRKMNLPKVDWMKVDVEGGELEVLAGASRALREFRPTVFIEVHETLGPLLQTLESLGYMVTKQTFDQPPEKHGWIMAEFRH